MEPPLVRPQREVVEGILDIEHEEQHHVSWLAVCPQVSQVIHCVFDPREDDAFGHAHRLVVS